MAKSKINKNNTNDKGIIANSFKAFEAFVAQIKMFWHMVWTIFLVITLIQIFLVFIVYKFSNGWIFTYNMNDQERCIAKTYVDLKIKDYVSFDILGLGKSGSKDSIYYACEASPMKVSKNLFREKFTNYSKTYLMPKYKSCVLAIYLISSLPLYVYGFIYFISKLNRRHKEETKDRFIRGKVVATEAEFESYKDARMLKGRQIAITNLVSIPESIVTRHNFVVGKPGSGKSQLATRILDQLVEMNVKLIIHDFKGDFIPMYYNEDRDYIFCPVDRRHMGLNIGDIKEVGLDSNGNRIYNDDDRKPYPKIEYERWPYNTKNHEKGTFKLDQNGNKIKIPTGWTVFNEVKTLIDVDAFAASIIPDSNDGEKFWSIAPRDIFKGILIYCIKKDEKLRKEEHIDLDDEKNAHLRTKTNKKICELLRAGTKKLNDAFDEFPEACSVGKQHLQEQKLSSQLLSILSANTSFFTYLDGTDGDFSISKWIQDNDSTKRIIFIANQAQVQEALKPLITTFVDFATKALCSMTDDMDRRLYIILDEFGQLSKIGSVVQLLTQARSKGGAAFLFIQDQAQIQNIYGDNLVKSIVNSCGNKFYFAVGDQNTADQISQELGTKEVLRNKESKSFGVGDFKDTISQNADITETRIVLASEMMTLETLTCWAQITDLPLVHVKFSYTPPKNNTAATILRNFTFEDTASEIERKEINKATDMELQDDVSPETGFGDGCPITDDEALEYTNPGRISTIIEEQTEDEIADDAEKDANSNETLDDAPSQESSKRESIAKVAEKSPRGWGDI
jgi:hypothetical protein